MRGTRKMQERLCRKQIAFDLSEKRLQEIYPRLQKSSDPRYHKRAWTDVARFMTAAGFEHRQYSVYDSKTEMKEIEIYAMVWAMLKVMPWLKKCLEVLDVTDIGENQDLMPIVHAIGFEDKFDLERVQ